MNDIETTLTAAQDAIGVESPPARINKIDALASCTGPNGRFSTRVYSAWDGRMSMVQGDENGRRLLAGIDAVEPWVYRAEEQTFTTLQPASQTFLRGHELHMIALAPQTRFGAPQWGGEGEFGGEAAVAIRFRDQLDAPLNIFYGKETGLPLGLTQVNHSGRGAERITVTFADWQPQDSGLQLFRRATFAQGDDQFTYNFVRLAVNAVPDVLLDSPQRHAAGADAALLHHLHDQQQTAHLTHDAGLFTSVFHDPIMQINRGEIVQATREESRQRSQAYFDRVEFVAWEDVSPPVIRVAVDGSMASVAVHKRVHIAAEDAEGQRQERETIFAWLESWEKVDGKWRLMAVASTNG